MKRRHIQYASFFFILCKYSHHLLLEVRNVAFAYATATYSRNPKYKHSCSFWGFVFWLATMTTMTTHHPPSLAEMRDKASPVPRIAGHHDHQCPLIPHLKHGRVINLATFPLVKPFWPPLSLKTQDRSDHCAITASPILKPRRPAFIFGSGTHLHPSSLPSLMEGGGFLATTTLPLLEM